VLDFHIIGVTRSKVVGSVLAGRRLARRVTPDGPEVSMCDTPPTLIILHV
jgi:hypothetical protein